MSGVSRWRDSGHLERAAETAGGREAFDAAVAAMLDDARGWRLAAGGWRLAESRASRPVWLSFCTVDCGRTRRYVL
jgi:hypothetical protein